MPDGYGGWAKIQLRAGLFLRVKKKKKAKTRAIDLDRPRELG